ncbi:MAG: Hsp70 family protein, partial [Myxococcales bacterium]
EDFDRRILEWLVFNFAKEHDVDLRGDKMALQRLKEASEKAKCELSSVKETQINLPFLYSPVAGGTALHLTRSLTREKYEELTADLVERCIAKTKETLSDASVRVSDVKEVLLVGGMTRVPRVQEAVKKLFGREPSRGVHPEEVVALGAAVQAAALMEEQSKVVLLDVTPHSLGVAIAGGYARPLIGKNTTVPTSATQLFNTSKDYQTTVKIMVLQGESQIAEENELLGEFVLSGLRSAPRGEVEIEVTFDISADGIVSVSARDKLTGLQQSITVTASGGLTRDELSRILDEQRDYLLEAQSEEEAAKKREEIGRMLSTLEGLIPRVNALVAGSDFGKDAVTRAQRSMKTAESAVSGGANLAVLAQSHDELTRAVSMFEGLVAKLGR